MRRPEAASAHRHANNLAARDAHPLRALDQVLRRGQTAGTPWITRLPFPVQVVERVETRDAISRNIFATRYAYHHGYYDGVEREFRGFARVDTLDTDTLPAASGIGTFTSDPQVDPTGENFDLPPVLTVTWYHTGAYIDGADTATLLGEYWAGDSQAPHLEPQPSPPAPPPKNCARPTARCADTSCAKRSTRSTADPSRATPTPPSNTATRLTVSSHQPQQHSATTPFTHTPTARFTPGSEKH